jgi:hypothetical protein
MACGAPKPHTSLETARTIPFYIIDEDQIALPVQDFVAGTLELTPSGGRAIITERLMRGGLNERPETIAAGFAYGDRISHDWHIRRKGRSVPLGRISASAADTIRDTLVVDLPRSNDLALAQHWLFFEIWGQIRLPRTAQWTRAFRSLHSRADIFVQK